MKSEEQDKVVNQLQRAGIAARHAFKSMSGQEEFEMTACTQSIPVNTLRASQEVIYLPVQPGITTLVQVQRSFEVISKALAGMG